MPAWSIFYRSDHAESVLEIKFRGLKTMRREDDLLAIPTAGFVLYSLEEFCSQSLSAL
jgi:hypothetical protein